MLVHFNVLTFANTEIAFVLPHDLYILIIL